MREATSTRELVSIDKASDCSMGSVAGAVRGERRGTRRVSALPG
jgi:hypothetical protein